MSHYHGPRYTVTRTTDTASGLYEAALAGWVGEPPRRSDELKRHITFSSYPGAYAVGDTVRNTPFSLDFIWERA